MQHPMEIYLPPPAELKKQVEQAKKLADYFKNHWTWFYIVAGFTLYKVYKGNKMQRQINRIERKLIGVVKEANPYKISQKNKEWVEDYKQQVVAEIDMSPLDFLALTVRTQDEMDWLFETAHDLEVYNEFVDKGEILVPPVIWVQGDGTVASWEGRHRAVAVINNNENSFPVTIISYDQYKKPKSLLNAETGFRYKIK